MARTHAMQHRGLTALSGSIIVAALFAWLPLQAAAADLRQGSDVTIGPGETVNDDIYAGAGTISINGTVNGSVIAGGGTITVSGTITRDLILGGGTINVTGHVGGSIIAAGGNITVNGPIAQDLVVTGGTIDVGSGATIGRDLVVAGGSATVAASIGGRMPRDGPSDMRTVHLLDGVIARVVQVAADLGAIELEVVDPATHVATHTIP